MTNERPAETGKRGKLFGRDFTLMVVGQIISLFGNSILRFALSMAVLDMTGSAAAFASISALSMIPTILLSPLGGVLADRASRKGIMAVLDFAAAGLLLLFLFVFSAYPGVALIGVVMVLLSIIQSFYQPAVQSSIPSLVDGERLASANGVTAQVNALANLTGPVLGGFLYGIFGLNPILLVSIVCFFLSAVMECFLHIPYEKRPMEGGALRTIRTDFTDACRFMAKEQKALLQLLLVVAGVNLFFSPIFNVGLPYLIKIFLGLPSQMYGIIGGAEGVGAILGAMLAGTLAKKLSVSRLYLFLLAAGAITLPVGAAAVTNSAPMASFAVIFVSVVAMMVCSSIFNVLAQTILQKLSPDEMLGKIMAVATTMSMCAMPVGQALYGVLFDWAGPLSFLVVWLASGVCALLSLAMKRILRQADFSL